MARQTFLAPYPTCHRPIFLPNFATSVASIFFAKLSLAATVYRRLGMASFGHQPNSLTSGSYIWQRVVLAEDNLTMHNWWGCKTCYFYWWGCKTCYFYYKEKIIRHLFLDWLPVYLYYLVNDLCSDRTLKIP